MRKLSISAIWFLNTAPLMWDFACGALPRSAGVLAGSPGGVSPAVEEPATAELARDFSIQYTMPSQCAEALRAGTADIGIVPVAAYANTPGLAILPNVAIAAKKPVRSILLVSKVPLAEVRNLAADISSRTSVVLARVLFHRWFGRIPEFVPAAPQLDAMLAVSDAALLIGDAALVVDRSRHQTWDLAEEWQRLTGLSFVFAFWAVRMAALKDMRPGLDLAKVFVSSRDHGLLAENLAVIARNWAPRVRLSESEVISYLTENIDYSLDPENLAGMDLFFRYAAECGAIPRAPELRFIGAHPAILTV